MKTRDTKGKKKKGPLLWMGRRKCYVGLRLVKSCKGDEWETMFGGNTRSTLRHYRSIDLIRGTKVITGNIGQEGYCRYRYKIFTFKLVQ